MARPRRDHHGKNSVCVGISSLYVLLQKFFKLALILLPTCARQYLKNAACLKPDQNTNRYRRCDFILTCPVFYLIHKKPAFLLSPMGLQQSKQ